MNKDFTVSPELIAEFSDLLSENELANEIIGSTEDGDIKITIHYRTDQKGAVLDLIEWLDENSTDDEEEDPDDEE